MESHTYQDNKLDFWQEHVLLFTKQFIFMGQNLD